MKYFLIFTYAMITSILFDGKLPKPAIAAMGISVVILAEIIG